MTRRNRKRIYRNQKDREQRAHTVAHMLIRAMIDKAFNEMLGEKNTPKQAVIDVPTDGTAVEMPIQEGFEVFFSEDGKLMVRKKIEGDKKEEDKDISYRQLSKALFKGSNPYYWNINTDTEQEAIDDYECNADFDALFNCQTEAQVKRLMAFNKLQNIAQYLNDGWHPNFNSTEERKYFIMCSGHDKYDIGFNTLCNDGNVFFRTKEIAKEAIRIMGNDALENLFNVNW